MKYWDTSCPDWVERLKSGRPLVPDLPLFPGIRDKALRVFKRLRLPDVIGTPTLEEAADEWMFAIVAALFGSYDVETNVRHIQEAFILVPKKNSKSSGAGAIMLTAQILNIRPRAESILVAPTINIANIAFDQIEGMIKIDPELRKLFTIQRHIRTITHLVTGAELAIKAADADVITGGKAAFSLIDETHVFATNKSAEKIFVEIRGALAARKDGFLMQITTQSKDPPAGVFAQELQNARDVRDGKINLPMLAALYELPDDELKRDPNLWKNQKTWPWVNPNLGRSVNFDYLERELMKAERSGKGALALLASQHFNVEIGMAMRSDRWVGVDHWQACADKKLTLENLIERCEVIVATIDGGGLDDWFGLCLLGREVRTGRYLVWTHAWAHESVLERYPEQVQMLQGFEADGDLTITSYRVDNFRDEEDGGGVASTVAVDLDEMVGYIMQVEEAGKLGPIGVDPYGVTTVVSALEQAGIDREERMMNVSQGYKLQGAVKTTELYLSTGAMRHGGTRMMNHCVSNARTERKGNAILVSKAVSDGKIDPVMAMFSGVAVMATNPEPAGNAEIFSI